VPDDPAPAAAAVQRVAAYGVLCDDEGRVVLVRASDRSDLTGTWFLPGGGVDFGEHPRDAVVREVREETGVAVEVTGLRDVVSDVVELPHRGSRVHTVRALYDLRATGPFTLRPERDGTSDRVRAVDPARAADLPVMPFVAHTLGLPEPAAPVARPPARPAPLDVMPGAHPADLDALHGDGIAKVQRAGAYVLCLDDGVAVGPDRRILLTRLRDTDLWTLPGGGIDHGEHAGDAAVREVHEETGLPARLDRLLDVDSIRFTGHAPNGRLEDFHGVRVVYAGSVPTDVPPRVVEVDGSTEEVAWWRLAEVTRLHVAGLVRVGLKHLR
jgi:8-oxo-dGTP diphosphatase